MMLPGFCFIILGEGGRGEKLNDRGTHKLHDVAAGGVVVAEEVIV